MLIGREEQRVCNRPAKARVEGDDCCGLKAKGRSASIGANYSKKEAERGFPRSLG